MPKISDLQSKNTSKARAQSKKAGKKMKAKPVAEGQTTKKVTMKRRPGRKPKSVQEPKLAKVVQAELALEEVTEQRAARREGDLVQFAEEPAYQKPQEIYNEEPHATVDEVVEDEKLTDRAEKLSRTGASADEPVFEEAANGFAFPGSELLKQKFPKSFAVAKETQKDWVRGGDFRNVPIEPIIVRELVAAGLRQAKSIETRLHADEWIHAGLTRVQQAKALLGSVFKGGRGK